MPREHSSILCVGWSVKDHCWRLPLVRIDGERTTKRPPRIYHLPFKVKDRRIQGDGYVCERGGSYTYGLNHKIMTFQIWSSPTNERCHSPATSVFVKALPTYSIRDRKRCWPRIGRVAASNDWMQRHESYEYPVLSVFAVSKAAVRRVCGGLFVVNGLFFILHHSCSCFGDLMASKIRLGSYPLPVAESACP